MTEGYQSCAWCGELLDLVDSLDLDLDSVDSPKFCSSCQDERRKRVNRDDD